MAALPHATGQRLRCLRLRRLFVAGAALVAAGAHLPALADRPFIATISAAAEEDDDRVWSLSTAARQDREHRSQGIVAEYAFEPRLSLEFSLQRERARGGEDGSRVQGETELKWLFNHIARDGWGAGVSLALGATKESGATWRTGGWQLVLPFSWQWSEDGGLLHLNWGLAREPGQARESIRSVAAQVPLGRRFAAFAEWAADGEGTLRHAGLRWWLKRERVALDFSAARRAESSASGQKPAVGWVLGLSFYDL